MEHSFWEQRWREKKIGFHEDRPNELLLRHFARLNLAPGNRILVPLCGKSHDLGWLLGQGLNVTGIELSRIAVEELFDELGVTPTIEECGSLTRFSFEDIAVFNGNFFELTKDQLGAIDAIYDRAALVALPETMRGDYARHLMSLSGTAPQLLVSFDYDQAMADGPPFSVPRAEIEKHYGQSYEIELLESAAISGNLATRCSGSEDVWLLSPK